MRNVIAINCLILGLMLVFTGFAYAKHPAEGHPVMDYWWVENCHFPPAALSINDLTFMPEDEYPDYDSLTQLELYMLFGVQSSARNANAELPPYSSTIFSWVMKYENAYGTVPDQLTPEVIRSIPGYEDIKDEWLTVERNPLTGEWPRLTAIEHSPGDFYFRALTDEEVVFFASNGFDYLLHPSGGKAERTTPVFYMRMYGYDGVLSNGFKFLAQMK